MVEIVTARLRLREFERDDWQFVHQYASDPEVVRFMEWGPNTVEETKEFIDKVLSYQSDKPRYLFELGVTLRDTGRLIGAAGIRVLVEDPEQAHIGYCYRRDFWRNGYGTEACQALIRFGFEKLHLSRIYATCDSENIGSARVLEKSGMHQEGHFKQDRRVKGRRRDTLLYGLLNDHDYTGASALQPRICI